MRQRMNLRRRVASLPSDTLFAIAAQSIEAARAIGPAKGRDAKRHAARRVETAILTAICSLARVLHSTHRRHASRIVATIARLEEHRDLTGAIAAAAGLAS